MESDIPTPKPPQCEKAMGRDDLSSPFPVPTGFVEKEVAARKGRGQSQLEDWPR